MKPDVTKHICSPSTWEVEDQQYKVSLSYAVKHCRLVSKISEEVHIPRAYHFSQLLPFLLVLSYVR